MDVLQILILAVVQGVAELLPVSSSAHVIIAEKLMGLDPTSPQSTLLLVMLHTGTMFAVIVYFWKSWCDTYFRSARTFRTSAFLVLLATAVTGVVGLILLQVIKRVVASGAPSFEIEHLFGNTRLIAGALAAAGVLIVLSSRLDRAAGDSDVSLRTAAWIGAVQGLCLPFRGFSRSGATISMGLIMGVSRRRAEEFSFALAVALTPAVLAKEAYRLYASLSADHLEPGTYLQLATPGLLGMVLSFAAGLMALRWLSRWLEQGRWHLFGLYCLLVSPLVLWLG